jgi:peptidylprolyl isomerase domain and WD repeat-containing protein 1
MSDESSSSDEDVGPQPIAVAAKRAAPDAASSTAAKRAKKRPRTLAHEGTLLACLPSAHMYETSYMHRDVVRFVFVSTTTDFLLSISIDGVVKFWKKCARGVEFVKEFRAHLTCPSGASLSQDGMLFATTHAVEQCVKLFDVANFDMVQVVHVRDAADAGTPSGGTEFSPGLCCWTHSKPPTTMLAVASAGPNDFSIRLFRGDSTGGIAATPHATVAGHIAPICAIAYNSVARVGVSADARGVIEYWNGTTGIFPHKRVKFKYTSETDLTALITSKATPWSITVSPDGTKFVVLSSDQQVRVFSFFTGKLRRQYDERSRNAASSMNAWATAVFDDSSQFIVFPSAKGFKVVNLTTNSVARVLGDVEESEHFLACALYQGVPHVESQREAKRAASEGLVVQRTEATPDPTLICTSLGKGRFYLFSTREPEDVARDVYNEKPTQATGAGVAREAPVRESVPGSATVHTNMGDITVQLYAEKTPITVKNWIKHAKTGYYDNVVFHRVIKGFMLQTGDPTGTGRGGESAWGGHFEDEIVPNLKHDRPGVLSMANAGPGTNGSQFFITVAATPWLDGKHTVFGRVVSGMNTVTAIENCHCDRENRPLTTVKILNVTTT